STAARRMLRPGPARTALSDGADPGIVMEILNRCPDPPQPSDDGLPPLPDDFDERLGEIQKADVIDTRQLAERMQRLGGGLEDLPDPPTDPQDLLDLLDGLEEPPDPPLVPPEVCVGLDRPVWRDLNEHFTEWLLPGVGNLPDDSVIALQTNPVFTDAFLIGYNTQVVSELRWRNLRIATGCTPLRVFWERAHTGTGARVDDVIGFASWSDGSHLGAPSHRPGDAAATDLVLVFRGQIFLRFPKTAFYLVSAVHGGVMDLAQNPDPSAPKRLPSFQGRIGADVMFFGFQGVPATDVPRHWVALEEPRPASASGTPMATPRPRTSPTGRASPTPRSATPCAS
ncbi:MAG TPA: hypothetical protein VEP73_12725, partial [Actinomycetota bacterium]|nr:hypothetical protein [Actinomycetota bacterium]